jgi:release factor glutamine methyltransferase
MCRPIASRTRSRHIMNGRTDAKGLGLAQALGHARNLGLDALDAQLLMLHALGMQSSERAWLIAHSADTLPEPTALLYQQYVDRRRANEPVAYIIGRREFYGLQLYVDARVLVPRQDTETLVDWALELLRAKRASRVLDLGTGSGAIALALKSKRPDLQVCALDASVGALEVARHNATSLALDIGFVHGHWLRDVAQTYDLVLSNPPYVREGDPHLAALVAEPMRALVSGPDGLDAMREIVGAAPRNLAPGGWLLLEHGHDHADDVRGLLQSAGFQRVGSRKDLAGIERCSGGRVD